MCSFTGSFKFDLDVLHLPLFSCIVVTNDEKRLILVGCCSPEGFHEPEVNNLSQAVVTERVETSLLLFDVVDQPGGCVINTVSHSSRESRQWRITFVTFPFFFRQKIVLVSSGEEYQWAEQAISDDFQSLDLIIIRTADAK